MSTEKQSTVAPTTRVPDERLIEYEGVRGMFQNMGRRVRGGELGFLPVVVGLAIIWTIFGSLNSAFLSPTNLSNLLMQRDRKSTRLNSSHVAISYAVFCLKKKKQQKTTIGQ